MPNFDLFINQERYQHCHCRDLLGIYVCHLLKFTTPNKSTIQFIRHIFDISYIQKHTGDFKGQFIENASCLLIVNEVFRLFLFHNHDLDYQDIKLKSQTTFYSCISNICISSQYDCCYAIGYDSIST